MLCNTNLMRIAVASWLSVHVLAQAEPPQGHSEVLQPGCTAAEFIRFTGQLAPVPCKEDMAHLAQQHFYHTGRAAEIGVFQGEYAEHNLGLWQGEYWAIDAWQHREGDTSGDKNEGNRIQNKNYMITKRRTNKFGDRIHLVRNFSVPAASSFEDASFDWLYVDALHTHDAVLQDLEAWWPKLRVGGLLSGDDYGDLADTPYLNRDRQILIWGRVYDGWKKEHLRNPDRFWGTISAAQEFAAKVGASLSVTWLSMAAKKDHSGRKHCYQWPAWYMIKPPPFE